MIRKWRYDANKLRNTIPSTSSAMTSNAAFQNDNGELTKARNGDEHNISIISPELPPPKTSINGSQKSFKSNDQPQPIKFVVDCMQWVGSSSSSFYKRHKKAVRYTMLAVLNMAILTYFFLALNYWYSLNTLREWEFCSGFGLLLILYSLIYYCLIYYFIIKPFFGKAIDKAILTPIVKFLTYVWSFWIGKIIITCGMLTIFLVTTILDTKDSRERYISLGGYAFILVLGFLFSKNPGKINWKPVFWGVIWHWNMGFLTIKLDIGRAIFQCLGDKVNIFLTYAEEGSSFVFSDYLVSEKGVFAFKVLPVIFFFSLIIEILFHWGTMQWICLKLGWFIQALIGGTVCESVIVSANIFLGMSESPLLIKPYIPDLTKSEIHTIMTSGFATVSGTVLAAYISFGVNPAFLITASVMAAPAALCFSKLFYPEDSESKTDLENIKPVSSDHSSALAAATTGASNAIPLVMNIAANLVAFVSVVAFFNGILSWFGMLVGLEFLSFEWIIGKIFTPVSFVLGVPWEECELVGSLIGLKTVVNEFVAYQRLGQYKDQGLLSQRSEAIATYALCGFTNPSAVGILVGALSAMAPSKKPDITNVAVRAFMSGCAVCFMSACVAGLLISPADYNIDSLAHLGE